MDRGAWQAKGIVRVGHDLAIKPLPPPKVTHRLNTPKIKHRLYDSKPRVRLSTLLLLHLQVSRFTFSSVLEIEKAPFKLDTYLEKDLSVSHFLKSDPRDMAKGVKKWVKKGRRLLERVLCPCIHCGQGKLIPVGAWEPQERGLRAALQEGKEAGGWLTKSPSSVYMGPSQGISSVSADCPAWVWCQVSGAPWTQ